MKINAILFAVAVLAALFPGLAYAEEGDAGFFSCPGGQTEDLDCAAQCCVQQGGSYDTSQQECVVETQAQWNAAAACETENNCCTDSETPAQSGTGSSCCSSAAILLAGVIIALIR